MEYFERGKTYSGKEFNKIVNDNNLILVKPSYHDNEITKDDNKETDDNKESFTDIRYLERIDFKRYIYLVKVPDDASVYIYTRLDGYSVKKNQSSYEETETILKDKYTDIHEFYKKYLIKDKKTFMSIIKHNLEILKIVIKSSNDKEILLNTVKFYGLALQFFSYMNIDREICLEAVKNDGFALKYVPKYINDRVKIIDKEICLEAVKQDGESIQFVPKNIIDKEICLNACEDFEDAIEYVPEELIDEEICSRCTVAVNCFIPPNLKHLTKYLNDE
jgi:hypothetical protein